MELAGEELECVFELRGDELGRGEGGNSLRAGGGLSNAQRPLAPRISCFRDGHLGCAGCPKWRHGKCCLGCALSFWRCADVANKMPVGRVGARVEQLQSHLDSSGLRGACKL